MSLWCFLLMSHCVKKSATQPPRSQNVRTQEPTKRYHGTLCKSRKRKFSCKWILRSILKWCWTFGFVIFSYCFVIHGNWSLEYWPPTSVCSFLKQCCSKHPSTLLKFHLLYFFNIASATEVFPFYFAMFGNSYQGIQNQQTGTKPMPRRVKFQWKNKINKSVLNQVPPNTIFSVWITWKFGA